ncbi:M23 family metallopeptidase [Paeniglutamicibacter gangotriensis]|uniref:M23 family metallopeptidase n=1 Tax=Paeniglutamicibacter gangotriensis TaxID=254787 RepID=UPI0037C8B329
MRGNHLTQQQNSGRFRASNSVETSPSDGSLEQIVGTALTGESTSRRPGRRASSAVPDSVKTPNAEQKGGRRYVASSRYAASPEPASIASTELPSENDALRVPSAKGTDGDKLDNVLKSAPRAQRPRLGFVHKLAAIAAVTGLAFAAAPAQEAEKVAADPQRVAQSAVADVKAPADDNLTVDRASVTSEYIEPKKETPAPVTSAGGKTTTKADKLGTTTTAAAGGITEMPANGALAQPVDSIRLTSRYGHRKNPTGPGYMIHNGLDYAVPMGTPVKASASGTVVQAEFAGHSGYRVKIDHGNGLETSYNHNSSLQVSVGQKVSVGEVVALSGSTGNSTGPHLHLEVIVNGQWVNPESRL